jgi:hypothetical protein
MKSTSIHWDIVGLYWVILLQIQGLVKSGFLPQPPIQQQKLEWPTQEPLE